MIDLYMDRADAATSRWQADRDNNVQQLYGDPRYWNGQLYATVIDRQAAEAKRRLSVALANDWLRHRWEMESNIKLGDSRSMFWPTGRSK